MQAGNAEAAAWPANAGARPLPQLASRQRQARPTKAFSATLRAAVGGAARAATVESPAAQEQRTRTRAWGAERPRVICRTSTDRPMSRRRGGARLLAIYLACKRTHLKITRVSSSTHARWRTSCSAGAPRMQRAPPKRLASEAFESHGGYLAAKDAKLAAQGAEAGARLRAERGDAVGASETLFAGVRLWVNGLTDPPAEELKDLVLLHGGEFFNTHSPSVTHIVTAQLSRAREDQLRRSKTAKVVTAAWVVESQRLGRLQDEARFSGLAPDSAQQSISALLPGAHAGAATSPEQLAVRRGAPVSTLGAKPAKFLTSFLGNSRLHHIGSWRHRIPAPLCAGPQPSADPALERVVMHVDMDCFFVSVMICDRPELQGLPVVVSHGNASSRSSGEVSSVSYAALKFGIRKGMRMCDAHRMCPNVVVLPYEFDRFDAVSQRLFDMLASFSAAMQPVSIDEAYLDVTGITDDPVQLAGVIRENILKATKCCASIGIGPNKLVAKIATRKAKPDANRNGTGIFRVSLAEVSGFLAPMQVVELHGVGYERAERLHAMGIETAGQLLAHSLPLLRKEFGPFEGARLQMIAQGVSDSPVQPPGEHQSISVNCNWGVRFNHRHEADAFLAELARELAGRLETDGRMGRRLTLKAMRSRDITVEPPKFLGHGWCDTLSKSVSFKRACGSAGQIAQEAKRLLTILKIEPTYIRGLGLAMSNLVVMTAGMQANPGLQPSVEDAYGAAGVASDRPKAARRPVSERAPLASTHEYADVSQSQLETLPQDVLDALGPQEVAALKAGLRQTRNRSNAAGRQLPVAKPPHPVAKLQKARKSAKASKSAKGSAPKPPAPMPAAAAPEPTSIYAAEPCQIAMMRTALREGVQQLAMLDPVESDKLLVQVGRLLKVFCSTCVMQNDLLSVQRLLRFARSLVAETPSWKEQCEAAVVATQRAVWERFHTSVQLTDS